jgi:hypothetical protein
VVNRCCGNEDASGLMPPSSYAGRPAREPPL